MMWGMKSDQLRAEAQTYGPEALLRLVELMRMSSSDTTALKASAAILHRAYPAALDKAEKAGGLDKMPRAERIEVLREALSKEELDEARERGMIS